MPGKARVHELAKEFGVDSKTVLAKLKEQGEFVKSASSTVEAPVARRLREALGAATGGSSAPSAPAAPAARPSEVRSSIAADRIVPIGFARSWPARCGADPWIGSYNPNVP